MQYLKLSLWMSISLSLVCCGNSRRIQTMEQAESPTLSAPSFFQPDDIEEPVYTETQTELTQEPEPQDEAQWKLLLLRVQLLIQEQSTQFDEIIDSMVKLIGTVGTELNDKIAALPSALAARFAPKEYSFGGIYSTQKNGNCLKINTIVGACACPTGFSPALIHSIKSDGTRYEIYMCHYTSLLVP